MDYFARLEIKQMELILWEDFLRRRESYSHSFPVLAVSESKHLEAAYFILLIF